MDTSETYIKMCDCPEIQGEWKPIEGDLYFFHGAKTFSIYSGMCIDFIATTDIWLPRQDEIQEMIRGRYGWIWPLHKFEKFDPDLEHIDSMEQLWLAFYMYEKHKKIWDGEKWRNK